MKNSAQSLINLAGTQQIRREKDNLRRLLSPQSVAIIGASDDADRIGGRPISYMEGMGYKGLILPVNPKRETIQGHKAYASVQDLPQAPDVAIVAISAKLAPDVIANLAASGTGAAIVFTAGFAETGEDGVRIEREMTEAARASGMRLLGPNCLGLINTSIGFCGSFSSVCKTGFPVQGNLGIASQSGAYGSHLLSLTKRRNLGVSVCAMTGNEADITVGELIHTMADDDQIEVIAAYLEGLNNPASLIAGFEAARAAGKPVIAMKVGTSPLGSVAAQSHTASLAGDDAVFDAILKEHGVFRAATTDEMLDVARVAARRIYPVNNTLGVITVSGGAGVLMSDVAHQVGLDMPPMPEESQARLKEILPISSPRNPVDCTAQFLNDASLISSFGGALADDGGYSSIIGFFTYAVGTPEAARRLCDNIAPIRDRHPDKLFVFCVIADDPVIQMIEDEGFVVFEDASRAVRAVAAMGVFGAAFAATPPDRPETPPVALPDHTLSEVDSKALLATHGIEVAPEVGCRDADAAVAMADSIGYPVVLKILSPDILHKSEIGGVLLDVDSAEAVREGFDLLISRARDHVPQARLDGVVVAKQLTGGVECILGIKRDAAFGPVAVVGLGGIFVEVVRDVALRRCPVTPAEAEEMILSLRGVALLQGARGRPSADIPALAQMLSRLSIFAAGAGPQLAAIDLNPVLAMPVGAGAYAADAVIEINDTPTA